MPFECDVKPESVELRKPGLLLCDEGERMGAETLAIDGLLRGSKLTGPLPVVLGGEGMAAGVPGVLEASTLRRRLEATLTRGSGAALGRRPEGVRSVGGMA